MNYSRPRTPVDIFMGTFGEAAAEVGTFGIFRPDIVPQEIEEQFPVSATVGRVAGSVAAFVGTTVLTGGFIGSALRMSAWGRGVLAVGVGAKAITGTKLAPSIMRGTAGAIQTAANFSLQDVAREFVDQMREQDYNAWEIGTAAARGALTGGVFGMTHNAFIFSHPSIQILAGASAFATAEAVNLAAEGDPITKEALTTSFLVGAALSSLGARGWKKRTAEAAKRSEAQMVQLWAETQNPKLGLGKTAARILKTNDPEAYKRIEELGLIKILEKPAGLGKAFGIERAGGLYFEGAPETKLSSKQAKDVRRAASALLDNFGLLQKKTYKGAVGAKPRRVTEFTDNGKTVVFDITGEKVNKLGDLTVGGATTVHKRLTDIAIKDIFGPNVDPAAINIKFGTTGHIVGSASHRMHKMGAGEVVSDPETAFRIIAVETAHVRSAYNAAFRSFEVYEKGVVAGKARAVFKGARNPIHEKLWDILATGDKASYEAKIKALVPQQRDAVKTMRAITDYYYNRTNQALITLGEKPFEYREQYLHHIVEAYEGKSGTFFDNLLPILGKRRPKISKPYNPTIEPRKVGLEPLRDPGRAIDAMVNYDLKTIYLTRPLEIMQAKLTILKNAGILQADAEAQITKYANIFLLGHPTETAREMNKQVGAHLKNGKFGKAVNGLIKRLTGRDISDRPVDAMASTWGRAVSNAFIVGRLDLALRNLTQVLHAHAVVGSRYMLQGAVSKMPKRLQTLANENAEYRAAKHAAEEGMENVRAQMTKALGEPFMRSHEINIDIQMKARWFQYLDMVTNPKNAKYNWATKEGMAHRAKLKANGVEYRGILHSSEEANFQKVLSSDISNIQYVYDRPGLPGVFANPAGRIAFKLQSFPMNYFGNYLDMLYRQARTGKPIWAEAGSKATLPLGQRLGIFKHFVGLSVLVGVTTRAGVDFSDVVGVSIDPWAEEGKPKIRTGVFDFRPSPGIQAFTGLVQSIGGRDEYERLTGWRQFQNSFLMPITGLVAPGALAAKTLKRAATERDRGVLIFRKPYKRTKKAVFDMPEYRTNIKTF